MLNFVVLLAAKVALVVTLTWKAEEIRETCQKVSAAASKLRIDKPLQQESGSGRLPDWKNYYKNDQLSHLPYERGHGGIGP